MGKDECCESCRRFAGDDAVLPEVPPAVSIAAAHERVKIVVRQRGGAPFEVAPSGPTVTVGRTAGNDVVLPSGTISRRQCVIAFEHGGVFVSDANSACGTYLDGRKVHRGEVREGSVIFAGDFELRVVAVS